jgi:uncharacterized membrane protein
LVLLSIIVSLFAYPRLPATVATHWSLDGQVTSDNSKLFATVFFPVMILLVWGFMRGFPRIDPWRANYGKMQGAYDLVLNAGLTLALMVQLFVFAINLGASVSIIRVGPIVVGVALMVIGNVLPRARQNFWFGIRTPWTLTNPRVWERTHRVAGYLMVTAGVLVVGTVFFPSAVTGIAIAVIGIATLLGTVIYSYFAWRQETSR